MCPMGSLGLRWLLYFRDALLLEKGGDHPATMKVLIPDADGTTIDQDTLYRL